MFLWKYLGLLNHFNSKLNLSVWLSLNNVFCKKVKNKAEISINKISWSSCLIYNVLKIFNFSSNNKWIRHVCFNMSHIWDKIQGAIDMFLIFQWNAPYVNVLPPGNKMVSWEYYFQYSYYNYTYTGLLEYVDEQCY